VGKLRQLANPNALRLVLNRWLRPLDLGLYRPSWVEALASDRVVHTPVPLPEGAQQHLQASNPRLIDLRERYRGHPAAAVSGWSDLRLEREVELAYFRGDSQYLYQGRGTPEAAYALSAGYIAQNDSLGLLESLEEDGAFGALTFSVDGRVVSRDLLDSILEIDALADWLGAERFTKARLLDVGAGYGRLAHRLCTWSPEIQVVATDAVPVSTFLCEYYLRHRGLSRARAVPLDEAEPVLAEGGFDVAVNIHSFGEAPRAAVNWWLERVAAADVPRLLIVHGDEQLFALESDLSRSDYADILARLGYRRVDLRPKYPHSDTVQRLGVFPAWYHLFERA
jgi:hypothetical protein